MGRCQPVPVSQSLLCAAGAQSSTGWWRQPPLLQCCPNLEPYQHCALRRGGGCAGCRGEAVEARHGMHHLF